MIPIPNPVDFDVSLDHGFLPTDPPLRRLPHPQYAPWEDIAKNLQGLILSKRLRETVDRMTVLSTDHLATEPEWRRAYTVLAFIVHAYIWGSDKPAARVPPPLTIPFLATCRHLELPPVATYAGVCLWNWKPIFPTEHDVSLANLDTLLTYTGSIDEKWFYLVSVAIEARGAVIIPLMLRAIEAARNNNSAVVTACLQAFAERLDELGALLMRMYDNCDPHVFYHRIRPFLAGSKNMAAAGLPNGIVFDDGGPINKQRYVQFSGGSNAQSSIIQFFDIVLDVEHHPTRGTPTTAATTTTFGHKKPGESFIAEMRKYMPGPHARFLAHVARVANLRAFVQAHAADRALTLAFDACLAMLSAFRDKHIQIVSRYIIVKSHEAKAHADKKRKPSPPPSTTTTTQPTSTPQTDGAAVSAALAHRTRPTPAAAPAAKRDLKGTGGTSLIPFLRQARDETGAAAVEAWTRRILAKTSTATTIGANDDAKPGPSDETDSRVLGMSGVWAVGDETMGGLCQV